MKRRTEFKGYVTQAAFDAATGTFVNETLAHGFAEIVPDRTAAQAEAKPSAVVIKVPKPKKAVTEPSKRPAQNRRVSVG